MTSYRINNLQDPSSTQDAATKSYVDTSIPIGGIIMWSGTTNTSLPSNWKLCDGSTYNSITTPDLRGRFVLSSTTPTSVNGGIALAGGLTARAINGVGGAETVALTVAQMPSHKHDVSATTSGTDGDHTHTAGTTLSLYGPKSMATGTSWNTPVADYNSSDRWSPGSCATTVYNTPSQYIPSNNTGTQHKHTITVGESSKGDGAAHENMPPFYVLAFIMRIS